MRKPLQPSPDEAIDQALAALRNVRPAEGLETRILASLHHSEPLRRPVRRWLPVTLGLATTSLLVAALMLRAPIRTPISTPTSSPAFAYHSSHPRQTSVTAAQVLSLPSAPRRTSTSQRSLVSKTASSELASFPAPPAPLTEQEKMLLRIAHRGDPKDLELLNPEAAARELAQNMAAFDHFFPPPPPFGPPVPKPSTKTPAPKDKVPDQEIPNEAHPTDR